MQKLRVGIMLELMWPFRRHVDVFAGTQRYAQEAGAWACEIDEYQVGQSRKQSHLPSYDGLIGRAGAELSRRARRARLPLVNVWFSSPAMNEMPGVFPDFAAVGTEAATHLLERGFRQFGCLSMPRERPHRMMIAAFHQTIRQSGSKCLCAKASRYYYRTGTNWSRFQKQLDEWISTWSLPIALFVAFNDVTIRYVANACRRNGLRIPEDVALISSTNEPMISSMPPPSLSSVEVNYEQMGYHAAKMLDRLMQKSPLEEKHVFIPPSGVIARDSTDFFAVEDEFVALAMRFIERNSGADVNVDSVAKAVGVSRRTLERRFRDSTGRSIAQELRRLRLMKAKRLLAETDLLVKQIAHETGFRNSARLHEVFVREEGTTPGAYRQSAKAGD